MSSHDEMNALARDAYKVYRTVYADGLRKGTSVGEKRERERIIALLEATNLLTTIEGGALVNYADEAIALINGEN